MNAPDCRPLHARTDEQIARARAHDLHGFYSHLLTYIVVNLALIFINLATPGDLWFYWPAIAWGAGLLVHAFVVYGLHGLLGGNREERTTHQLLNRRGG